ncbi:unnamed protein product, partial [Iphiclides podalirius]
MAETFTGLKLKGELGRFGKTEICDVLGVYPMPDEKIQFMLSPAGDEVTTISRDGCVRAWYWDTVEQADPPEDDPYVELNPVAETCDAHGGIWTVDLEIDKIECNHRKVATCHAGSVVGMAALRLHPILITVGEDGALLAYNTDNQALLARYQFPSAATCLLYPPHDVDPTAQIIIVGYGDGVMRTLLIHPQGLMSATSFLDVRIHSEVTIHSENSVNVDTVDLISLLKPHSKSLTQITINTQHTLLVTMRHRPFPQEEDLASLDEEALKAKEDAEKDKDEEEEEWIGEIQLIESESMLGTTITWAAYCEEGVWVIQRDTGALLLVKPGQNKVLKYGPFPDAWCEDITVLKFICDGRYLIFGTNTGYIRVVRMPTGEEDSVEHHFMTWKLAQQKLLKKLKGRRLAKEETQPTPRLDFTDYYYLPMHDNYTGAITCIEISSDGSRMFTCGRDGNIFSYFINFPEPLIPELVPPKRLELPRVEKLKEPSTVDGELMSHEQLKQKEEYDKMMAIANAHKKHVREQLAELTVEYNKIIKANRALPYSQQIDLTLDPRPIAEQEKLLDEAKALTKRKLAHQLEASDLGYQKMYSRNIIQLDVFPFTLKAIRDPHVMIRPLRQKNLSQAFYDQFDEVHQKMAEAALRGRRAESVTRRTMAKKSSWGPPRVASFLLGLPPRPSHTLKKAWQEHLSRKPDPNAMPPGAAEALKEAEATIGNRLLKTQPDYVAPPGHNTQLRICMTRKEIHDIKREFNEKVLDLRQHKLRLVDRMKSIGERLTEIRAEIPHNKIKQPPPVPTIDDDLEFPEKNLEIKPEVIQTGTKLPSNVAKKVQERKKSLTHPQQRVRQPRVPRFVPITESRPLAASWDLLKAKPDQESSAIEVDIRERRITRHLYEQDMLLADAAMSIQQFDSRLGQLQRERIRVQA